MRVQLESTVREYIDCTENTRPMAVGLVSTYDGFFYKQIFPAFTSVPCSKQTDKQTDTIMAMGQQYDFNMAYDVLVSS